MSRPSPIVVAIVALGAVSVTGCGKGGGRFDRPLVAGEAIPLELMFTEAGTRIVEVRVVDPGSEPTDGADASRPMDRGYDLAG